MSPTPVRDSEGSLQHVVSLVLRTGVIVSATAGVLAMVYDLVRNGGTRVALGTFAGTPPTERRVGSILTGALALQPRALMMVAILLLVLTPIVRVVVSLAGFLRARDRVYVVVTTVVLLTLLASLTFGGATE